MELSWQGLRQGAGEAWEGLTEDAKLLGEAISQATRAKRLEQVARETTDKAGQKECPRSEENSAGESTQAAAARAAEASRASLHQLGARYQARIQKFWGSSAEASKPQPPTQASSPPSHQATASQDTGNPVLDKLPSLDHWAYQGLNNLANHVGDSLATELQDQAGRMAEEGVKIIDKAAQKVADSVLEGGKQLAIAIDRYTPAPVKFAVCLSAKAVPNPWSTGACTVLSMSGYIAAREDYSINASPWNGARVVFSALSLGSSLRSAVDMLGQAGYGIFGAEGGGAGVPSGAGAGAGLSGGAVSDGYVDLESELSLEELEDPGLQAPGADEDLNAALERIEDRAADPNNVEGGLIRESLPDDGELIPTSEQDLETQLNEALFDNPLGENMVCEAEPNPIAEVAGRFSTIAYQDVDMPSVDAAAENLFVLDPSTLTAQQTAFLQDYLEQRPHVIDAILRIPGAKRTYEQASQLNIFFGNNAERLGDFLARIPVAERTQEHLDLLSTLGLAADFFSGDEIGIED